MSADLELHPALAARPRVGWMPVPYVAMWEGEEPMRVAKDPVVWGRRSVFPIRRDCRDATKPIFGVMEPSRQREVVMTNRCQVCRAQLKPIDEHLNPEHGVHWLVDLLHRPKTYDGRVALEPFACGPCMEYALQACPGIRGRRNVLGVMSARPVATLGRPEGNLKGDARYHDGVVTYVKIEPMTYHRIAAELFLDYGSATVEELLLADHA